MKGIYCLIIEVCESKDILIGRLGKIRFEKGKYIYVGSAQNSLEKRIERHLKRKKKKHWHIDYLLENKNVKIRKVILFPYKKKSEESRLAKEISKFGKPIKNFGASDSTSQSHLVKI